MPAASQQPRRSVDLALVLLALVWGSSYLCAKSLLAVMGVMSLLVLRFFFTTVALLIIWFPQRQKIERRELRISLGLGLVQVVVFVLETFGVEHTSANNAGLIISLAIIFTPLLEGMASRNWLPAPFFVATTTAIVGVGVLVSSHGFRTPNVGDALMLAAACVRATHVMLMGHLTKGQQYSSVFMTFIQCAVCLAVFSIAGTAGALRVIGHLSATQWFALLFLGIACSALGFVIQLWAVRKTSAARASLLLGTEPLFAVLVAVIVGHETLPLVGVAGGAMIIGSTYVAQGIELRHRERL